LQINTFSIVVGTKACNAKCPFCVSRMTGFDIMPERGAINTHNFAKAARLAQLAGTTTVLLTGKGEPILYPGEITEYLELLAPYQFPFIELQTNALDIGRLAAGETPKTGLSVDTLKHWYELGLTTIAISTVGHNPEANRQVYHADYPELGKTVQFLHTLGFTVRLCVMMLDHVGDELGIPGVNDTWRVQNLINWCRTNKVDQLTIRPIRKPDDAVSHSDDTSDYVAKHGLSKDQETAIRDWCLKTGKTVLMLSHGAAVLDIAGQNVCISDCLTVPEDPDHIRTLIFYSDGRVAYTWQYDGALLLGGWRPNN